MPAPIRPTSLRRTVVDRTMTPIRIPEWGVDNAPLHALKDGTDGGNGVYIYSSGGVFQTSATCRSNYWVDVVFVPIDRRVARTMEVQR